MSRRPGPRTRARREQRAGKHAAPMRGDRRAGARAFARRALVAERRQVGRQRVQPPPSGLGRLARRLPAFPSLATLWRVPRAAWACAAVACLNAFCWSIVSPPFQVPDEPDHYAYVMQLAETGSLPVSRSEGLSNRENLALTGLHQPEVRQQPRHTIGSLAEERELELDLRGASVLGERGSPEAGVAASQPPLYYALESIPYTLAGGTVLNRLALMRVASAFTAGLVALFVFLFMREIFPRDSWAWTAAGLAVAVSPLLGIMCGAVNPDGLLYAVSAATFWSLARGFRRGLSGRMAIVIGLMLAIGLMTKLNFIGLLPGALAGVILLGLRAVRSGAGHRALLWIALTLGIGFGPAAIYTIINLLSGHSTFGLVSEAAREAFAHSPASQLNYIWQLYLPRIPGVPNYFPGFSPIRQIWFNGFVGLYGWLDTAFPQWVYRAALFPASLVLALFGRALFHARTALWARRAELVVYGAMAAGLLVLIGGASFYHFPLFQTEAEPRYLLPLLPLVGAALALIVRSIGRRWGPVAGVLIVMLFLAHDVFSQLLVVARYYG
jgi:Predicted membrane protein (DUF2142)